MTTVAPTPAPLCVNATNDLVPCTPAPPPAVEDDQEGYKWEIALVAVCGAILIAFASLTWLKNKQKQRAADAKKARAKAAAEAEAKAAAEAKKSQPNSNGTGDPLL
uniref:Uncharacterized protein n=1 Tax=Neobodo designis TaxID=312471 RepID=A0A7S1L0A4_NEODS|eukprot:CAMPEP_0174852040 /NCGR_PEP_ID=MMETSP1114-20130205/25133_1 /TAXON_ID=312471 /ORGANISM="Neobodo designis, Strain CCAP 1951/1" /LENGTH=105 /DNA_ID=CAMNT_0016086615 /DNA_START=36 /DNA_END=353 /DNA_ORIENTATION=+